MRRDGRLSGAAEGADLRLGQQRRSRELRRRRGSGRRGSPHLPQLRVRPGQCGLPGRDDVLAAHEPSTDYELTQGVCGGGSPRYQIDLQPHGDSNPADAVSLYLYFGTPPFGGCTSGQHTEGEVIGGTAPQWFAFGGGANSNVALTYSQARATYGNYQLVDAQVAVDGGWSQNGTQQVSITNWEINGEVFFPA